MEQEEKVILKHIQPKQKCSEEVSDIIDRMPIYFAKWVARSVVLFTVLLLFFGWIIKYPNIVSGQIIINSGESPIKLIANSNGKLHIEFTAQHYVNEEDYIAIIQNSANMDDVIVIKNLLIRFNPTINIDSLFFPDKVSLGELNVKYYSFLNALRSQFNYNKENTFEKTKQTLIDQIKWQKKLLVQNDSISNTVEENINISQKWHSKYISLNKDYIATYDLELDKSKIDILDKKISRQNLEKENVNINRQISENENLLLQLDVEQREKEGQLKIELLSSYHDLLDNIKLWEQKYVFKAPFDGVVEYLGFWNEDQFVQAGEEIFSVIPKENEIIAQMYLPVTGAGKVKVGNRVSIKLDDFPYREFGTIDGEIRSISLITNMQKSGDRMINTYLVMVDMPEGLKTNFGEELDFKFELTGIGDIAINERRLIERLFDNLKVRTK